MKSFGASSMASLVTILALYPLDTVRKCLQMNGSTGNANLYKNEGECVRLLYKFEGVVGFYRGVLPCALRKVPSMGLTFGMFEYVKSLSGV